MAEVLVFCSKTRADASGAVGIEHIALRHPHTHAIGWMDWQIMFPVDLAEIATTKRQADERERREWNMIKFQTGTMTRPMLLRDMAVN